MYWDRNKHEKSGRTFKVLPDLVYSPKIKQGMSLLSSLFFSLKNLNTDQFGCRKLTLTTLRYAIRFFIFDFFVVAIYNNLNII